MAQQDKRQLKSITKGLQVVPASAADLVAKTAYIFQLVVANTTASAVTFTVLDKASVPKTLVPTVSLTANSLTIISFPEGVKMTGGINWVAGTATALHADVVGMYEPG